MILGVGTRDYYRKMGYELEGPYMTKILTNASNINNESALVAATSHFNTRPIGKKVNLILGSEIIPNCIEKMI